MESQDPNEHSVHEIFAALREEIVTVASDFRERVAARVERLEAEKRSPGLGALLLSTLVEASNLIGKGLGVTPRDEAAPQSTDSEPQDRSKTEDESK